MTTPPDELACGAPFGPYSGTISPPNGWETVLFLAIPQSARRVDFVFDVSRTVGPLAYARILFDNPQYEGPAGVDETFETGFHSIGEMHSDNGGTSETWFGGQETPLTLTLQIGSDFATGDIHWTFSGSVTCGVVNVVPASPVLDFATTLSRHYLVQLDGSAWVWSGGSRTQLAIDLDGRQMAQGMIAVATSGEAAFFCDWVGNLWGIGKFYTFHEPTQVWMLVDRYGFLTRIPVEADAVTLLGPHGIGPAYMNPTALWVTNERRLIGFGPHETVNLLNGLLPSTPAPIAPPVQGAYAWRVTPPGHQTRRFDYRNYPWQALAMSNVGAYAQFKALARKLLQGQGYMVG